MGLSDINTSSIPAKTRFEKVCRNLQSWDLKNGVSDLRINVSSFHAEVFHARISQASKLGLYECYSIATISVYTTRTKSIVWTSFGPSIFVEQFRPACKFRQLGTNTHIDEVGSPMQARSANLSHKLSPGAHPRQSWDIAGLQPSTWTIFAIIFYVTMGQVPISIPKQRRPIRSPQLATSLNMLH